MNLIDLADNSVESLRNKKESGAELSGDPNVAAKISLISVSFNIKINLRKNISSEVKKIKSRENPQEIFFHTWRIKAKVATRAKTSF